MYSTKPVHVRFFGADCGAKLAFLRRLISTESFGPKPRAALRLWGLRHRRLGTDAGHHTCARQALASGGGVRQRSLANLSLFGTQNDFAGLIGIDVTRRSATARPCGSTTQTAGLPSCEASVLHGSMTRLRCFSRPVRVMTAPSVIAGGGRSVPIFTRTVPAAGSTDDATSRTLPVTLTARSDTSAMSAFLSTNSWVR